MVGTYNRGATYLNVVIIRTYEREVEMKFGEDFGIVRARCSGQVQFMRCLFFLAFPRRCILWRHRLLPPELFEFRGWRPSAAR